MFLKAKNHGGIIKNDHISIKNLKFKNRPGGWVFGKKKYYGYVHRSRSLSFFAELCRKIFLKMSGNIFCQFTIVLTTIHFLWIKSCLNDGDTWKKGDNWFCRKVWCVAVGSQTEFGKLRSNEHGCKLYIGPQQPACLFQL